jgi:hypothetical protein
MSGRKFQLPKKPDLGPTPQRNDSGQEEEKDYSSVSSPGTRSEWSEVGPDDTAHTPARSPGIRDRSRRGPAKSSNLEGEPLPRSISARDVDPRATGPTAADDGVVESSKPEGEGLPRSISAKDHAATSDPMTPSDVTGSLFDRVRSPTRHGTSSENTRDPIKSDPSHGNDEPTTAVIARRPDITKSTAKNGEIPPDDHKEWKSPIELECNRLCAHSLYR